jgi:nucleoside-diphosphate-sugar epimerase
MNVLITGVNGLIGNCLALHLLNNENFFVIGIDLTSTRINHAKYRHFSVNLSEFNSRLLESNTNIDVVVHLAQSRYYKEFPDKNSDVFEVNVHSTIHLLEWARISNVKQFIYASSGGIYGFGKNIFSEEYTVKLNHNLGFYLSTKLMGEMLVHNYSNFFTTTILRPFFVFGPNQNPNMLIPSLIKKIRNNQPITMKGEKGIRLNPIHVEDAAAIIKYLIINKSHGIFNICGNEIVHLKQIVDVISSKLNLKPNLITQPSNGNEDIIGDNQKIKNLGFIYTKNVFKEVELMCNYF